MGFISNCIVTKEFIVVTYSTPPALGPGVSSFELTIEGILIAFPNGASHTFVSSIPASIITWPHPQNQNPLRLRVGYAFTLTVTDTSGAPGVSAEGFVTEGAPEAIALLQNSFNQAMNAIKTAVTNPSAAINSVAASLTPQASEGPPVSTVTDAISGAATTVADAFTAPGGLGTSVTKAITSAATTIAGAIGPQVPGGPQTVTGAIADAATAVQGAINAPTFPILTEEIGYSPSPLARQSGGASAGGGAALGQVVSQALNGVLGWKLKNDDPKGFLAALNASFTCTEFEGHSLCTWQPSSYTVQSNITGGITGAQASIFARAKDALDKSLPLLDGLYPLDPTAEPELVTATREAVRSQLTQVVNEFGYLGGPRVMRVNTYFLILLGQQIPLPAGFSLQTNSDLIRGSLGDLRALYGIFTLAGPGVARNRFINTVEDEQDTTNFRVLADYVTSLAQSWINNLPFFAAPGGTAFFGTQLVPISRQLIVASEDVDEVRFAMDSVFIGPDERQALEVNFGNNIVMFFEDFALWVQSFVTTEAQQLIQDGGIYAVRGTVMPIIQQLAAFAAQTLDVNNPANQGLPAGFHTGRVQQSLGQLADDLTTLQNLLNAV